MSAAGDGFSWNSTAMPASGPGGPADRFFDETLRDGIQAPYVTTPSLEAKLALIDCMVGAGVRAADLGFPGSGLAAATECREIAAHVAASGLALSQGYAGRAHPDGVAAICALTQSVGVAVDAYVFVGTSPVRRYVEGWHLDSIADSIGASAERCRREGAEFVLVLEDAVRCPPKALREIYSVALDVGVRRMTLCDTVGAARPTDAADLVAWTARFFTEHGHGVELEWHGHNDRGLALANSSAALAAGCVRVHATVLGVGERAGNASIDQLIVNDYIDGLGQWDLVALRGYCEYASAVLGVPIPANYPAMGSDVFTTSAGVHAAAILKAHAKRDTELMDGVYSSIPASALGRRQEVVIDSASGASNVRYWLAVRDRQAGDTAIQAVLRVAKNRRAPLSDEEIGQIIATDI